MNIETFQAYISIIKDIFTCLAALTAAVIGIIGLQTWKKQLRGKTEYELAQRMLKASYKYREALAWVRNPIVIEGEVWEAMKEIKMEDSPSDTSKSFTRQQQAVYQKRWQRVQEASIELDSISLEAEAIWGQAARENVKPLVECAGTLFAALLVYFGHMENPQVSYSKEVRNRDHRIIFAAMGEKDNFFTNEITEAVIKIENFLKPYLKI